MEWKSNAEVMAERAVVVGEMREMVGREEREKLFLVWQLKNNWSEFIEIVKIRWSEFKVLKIRVRQ